MARDGSTITGTTTLDFDVRAVASSVTATMDILLLGRDPEAMADAYRRVVRLSGGLASPAVDVALPTFGHLRPGPVPALARELEAFERGAGLPPDWPPFTYRTLFLTLPALPGICLTPDGLLDVRTGRRLTGASPLWSNLTSAKRLVASPAHRLPAIVEVSDEPPLRDPARRRDHQP